MVVRSGGRVTTGRRVAGRGQRAEPGARVRRRRCLGRGRHPLLRRPVRPAVARGVDGRGPGRSERPEGAERTGARRRARWMDHPIRRRAGYPVGGLAGQCGGTAPGDGHRPPSGGRGPRPRRRTRPPVPLVDQSDFVAAPRPSPDGRWLAWMAWDHPAMPWDRSSLWLARLDESADGIAVVGPYRVAGGESSVGQPRWGRDGSLVFVDDRTGWWLPYRLAAADVGRPEAGPRALVGLEAEFHAPDWVLGQSTMAERSDGSLVCRVHRDGRDQVVRPGSGRPLDRSRPLGCRGGRAALCGHRRAGGDRRDRRAARRAGLDADRGQGRLRGSLVGRGRDRAHLGRPPVTGGRGRRVRGPTLHGIDPRRAPFPGCSTPRWGHPMGPRTGPPPLVVFCHGGPTSAAEGGLDPVVQFFASRGLAVAAVNYRGSSGFGRAVPAAPRRALGPGRHRRLRALRLGPGRGRPGRRVPHGHPGGQRRRADRARGPHPGRPLRRGGELVRRDRPRGPGRRHP